MNQMRGITKSFRARLAICAGFGIIIVAFLALLPGPTDKESFWLSVSESREMCRGHGLPSALSALKYKVINAVPPLKRWYYNRPMNVLLETILSKAPTTLPEDMGLGQPVATNSNGARVWIVAPAAASAFCTRYLRQAVTNDLYDLTQRGRIQTADRIPFFCTSRETNMTSYYTSPYTSWPPQWDDMEFNLIAAQVSNAFDLKVAMTPISSTGNTNAPFGFQLRAPAAGVVVIDCGKATTHLGKPYWIFIAATDVRANIRVLR